MVVEAYQCHGSNVGPLGTIHADNGHLTGGAPFVPVSCATGDVTHSLTRSAYKGASEDGTGRGTPIVPVSFGWMSAACQGGEAPATVLAVGAIPIQDGRDIDKRQNGMGVGEEGDPAYTVDTTGYQAVAQPIVAPTLTAANDPSRSPQSTEVTHQIAAVYDASLAVRRLTPRECEALMGWPLDWTRWRDDGTEIADSHRYRMCGNGVVAPVAEWIGRRLIKATS